MSHYMTALAMKQQGLKPATKIVLYWLADHHNSKTGLCCPGIDTLAEECEMHRTTVMDHLKALEGMGLIKRERRNRNNGSRTSNSYGLLLEAKVGNPDQGENLSRESLPPKVGKPDPLNLGSNNLGSNTSLREDTFSVSGGGIKDIWKDGVQALCFLGLSNRKARNQLGKWSKQNGKEDIAEAISQAREALTGDPIPYITAILSPKARTTGITQDDLDRISSKPRKVYKWN